MPERFLGIDTSNYRTSAAIYNAETGEWVNRGGLLTVPEGAIGLRQSDALFQHTVRLHEKIEALPQGEVRAIGVSNFKPRHLDALLEKADIAPMVDQIELHPGMPQDETVEYCRARDILVEAWGPLAQGRLFESVELDVLAAKHRKSVSQIVLRWHLQRGILPLPKSITPSRIVENAQLFDFELSSQEMNFITHIKCESSGLDPDTFRM